MDWNSKENYWDLTDFKREAIPIIDEFHRTSGGEFSIDLKLGRVSSNSNDKSINQRKKPGPGVSKTKSSPSVSTKRARSRNNGTQAALCLADGCNTDLTNCRDYHRRHKVCELHSKSPQVTIGGLKQRFCQQCSRFHSLEEFDEGKRSCRKRLDGHNRRRRKPQPDLLSRPGSFLSNFNGTHMLPFPSPHVYPTTTVVSPTWSGIVNGEVDASTHFGLQQQMHIPGKQNLFFGSSSSGSNKLGWKQFPFFQVDKPPTSSTPSPPHEAFICQPLLRNKIPLSDSSVAGSYSIFCDRLATITQVQDSNCALSLLSSTQTQTYGNHIVQPNSIPLVHPMDPMDSVLVSKDRHGGSSWSSGSRPSHTLPFNWE
ncbi:hypothetical protein GH714_024518 [Hevea brasiliensis]|uniref:SBP-type domain-containing protein n=1 Tax=Hevea brasiliensis TaxID=3981 RepID=A0A6A6MGF9_HEVBR|nr:hypothetical protein GH714_024518 [Hevea brasiliensis]